MALLVTDRLRGRPLAEADFDELVELHQDPRIVSTGLTPAETRAWLDHRLAHWREHGFGVWMFRDRGGGFVGRCGIHRWSLDGNPEVEIGYVVRSELWSQGFATFERAFAVDGRGSVLYRLASSLPRP